MPFKVVSSSALFLLLIFSFSFISASDETILRAKQYDVVDLTQTCSDCTYVNITSIRYPNSTLIHINEEMNKSGEDYSYIFYDTSQIGVYLYNTCGDLYHQATGDRVVTCENIPLVVSSDGLSMSLSLHILLMIIVFGLIVLGVAIKDVNISALGNFGLYYMSYYFIISGLGGFKNWVTEAMGVLLLALAFYTTFKVYEGYSDGM